jgi:hypothetical protein
MSMLARLAPLLLLAFALTACGSAYARPKAAVPATRVAYRTQWVDTHGIELAVPAAWKLNKGQCGTPMANTVLWNEDGQTACAARTPPGVSAVMFGGVIEPTKHATPETLGGVRVLRLPAFRGLAGRYVQLDLPRRGISVTVFSAHRALVRQILASMRTVRMNKDGCPTRPDPSFRLGSRPGSGQRFVPVGAIGLVGCSYDGRWLDVSSRVGSRAARQVAGVLSKAPYGFSRAPRGTIARSECASSWGTFSVAYFKYAHRPPVAVTAHLDGCAHLGASNGKWGVQMSYAWVPTFIDNVAWDGAVADKWGCGC